MRETWTPAPPATWHSGASSSSQPPGHIDQISSNYSQFYHHMEGQASQKANHTCHPVNILNMGNGEPGKSDMGNSFVAPLCGHAQFPGIENIWFLKSKTSLSTNNPLINGNDVLLRGGDYGMALPDVGVCHSSPTKNGSCQMSPGASGIHQENGNEPATSVLMLGPNGSYSANPFSSETRLPECSNHRKVGPLVFCMNRVGELFLNDMGLLGVLCLCHGICMSVAQFCEHSGSKQLDPGYAVCLENGESIACWRRLFLLNSGMRDSDDFTGWNWPEATFGSTGSMVTDTLTLKASAYKTSWMDSSFISFGRSPVDSCTSADNVRVGHIALKKLLNRVSDASLRLHNESLNSLKSQGDQLHAFPRSQFSDKRLWVADGTHTHGNLGVSTSLLNMGRHNEGQHLTSQEPVERSGKWMMSKDSLARKTLGGHTDIFCSGFELNYGAQARQHITGVNSGSFARLHTSETLSNPVNHQRHKFLSPKSSGAAYDLQKLEEPSLHCPSEGLTPNRCNLQQSNGSSNVIHLPDSESARSETHNGSPLTLFHLNTYEGNSTSQATDNDISHTQKSMSRVLEVESFADLNLKLAGVTNDGLERTSKITTMDTSAQICSGNTTRISSNGNCNCAWRPECFVPDSEGPMEAVDEQFTQSTSSFFNWRACSHSHDVLAGETKSSTIKQLGKELCQEKNGIHLHCLAWPKSMNSISYSRGLKQHLLDGNSSFCALKHMNDLCNKEAVPPLGKTHDRSLCCLSSVGLDGKEKEKGLMKLDKEAAESHSACFIQPCGPFGRTASSMQLVGPCSGGCSSCLLECDKRYMTLHSNCANMQPMFRFGRIDNEFANNAPHEFCNNDLSRCSTCKCLEVPGQKGYRKENCNTCTCHGISRCLSSHYFPEEKCINDLVKPSSVCCKAHFVPTSASHVNNDNRSNGCGVLEKHDVHLANDDHMQNSWNNIHIDPTIISIQKMHDILQSGVTDGQLVDTLKDYNDLSHEGRTSMDNHMSSIFPGYSAPAATEISIEADRGSYDSGAGQHSTADNLKDAGSSIERCGSSDGTCNSRKHRVDLSSNDKVNAMNGSFEISVQSSDAPNNVVMPGDSVNQEKLVSLLGSGENVHVKSDQKLQEGNRIKKWKKQDTSILKSDLPSTQSDLANRDEHFSVNYVEKNLHIQPINRMHKGDLYAVESFNCSRKQTALPRLKKHSLSNLQDSNGLIDEANSHSKVPKRFFTPLPRKKFRKLFSLNANALKTKQVEFHGSEEKHSNNTVTSGRKRLYSNGVEICQNDIRPVVCGDFGVISNRGLPADLQPPKIVLLSSVMKYARRTTLVKDEEYAKSTRLGMCETELKAYGGKSCDSITKDQPIATTFIANIRTKYIHTISSNSELHPGLPTSQSKRRKTNKRSLNELTEEDRLSGENFLHCELCKVFNSIANDGHCRGQTSCLSPQNARNLSNEDQNSWSSLSSDSFCCVCGSQDKDDANHLVECSKCLIKVHQACYGISKIPKERWFCRPCHTNSRDIACVICGYGGGAMTRAIRSQNIVKSLLKAWTIEAESQPIKPISSLTKMLEMQDSSRPTLKYGSSVSNSPTIRYLPSITRGAKQPNNPLPLYQVKNSVTDGARDPSIMQWVHVVCGLWTPGTRCRNVDTMSTFDVSGAYASSKNMVCLTCNRPGGCCIQCRVLNCSANFHPWCAHQKGLLQCEVEGTDPEKVGFYGRCFVHTLRHPAEGHPVDIEGNTCGTDDSFCARTKGYRGRNNEGFRWKAISSSTKGDASYLVPPEQMNAWVHINGQKSRFKQAVTPVSLNTEHDCRKEYVRYKSAKGWKSLVVYKSGIHALGLYTSRFIPRGAMVVEYVGEIVGLRVADKRETEYQSDSKLQHKSACYFFRIDKEHIIDATRKGGIARFVNHSCLPNCVAKIITVKNQKKVVFFAERDIYPGEEITYDYHFNHEDEGKKIPCFCNSKNCRRYLN